MSRPSRLSVRFLAGAAALVLAVGASVAGATTLKIATLSPSGSNWMRVMRDAAAEVETETEGRVQFKFYPGGVMGDDKAVLRKMRAGQLHGAALTVGTLSQRYTDLQLYGLPMVFRSYDEVDYVRERMDPTILAGLEDAGFVPFGFAEIGFAYAMSQSPVTSVADARAQRVWVPDGDPGSAYAVDAFGITPVPLTIADVLGGLQTGLVNAVAMPPVGALALQWHTQLDYVLDLPLLYVYGTAVVTERAFGRLSAADQEVLRRVMSAATAELNRLSREDQGEVLAVLEEQGLKLLEPSPAEVREWREKARVARARLVAEGVVTREAYETLRGHLETYRATLAE